MHYPVCEVVQDDESLYVRFFKPTERLWWAKLKLVLFQLMHVTSKQRAVTRIVDADRAAFLLVSYAEWRARRNLERVHHEEQRSEGPGEAVPHAG
jgi:hypothetical protein